jgi:hypothetical protein
MSDPLNYKSINMMPWFKPDTVVAESIIQEAHRYSPDLPFDPQPENTSQAAVDFYSDYTLVRLSASKGNDAVYGLYAPGDFHPIDPSGRAFDHVNAVAPLNLTAENVLSFALLRLSFALPAIVGSEHSLFDHRWQLANAVGSLEELYTYGCDVPNASNEKWGAFLSTPRIEEPREGEPKGGMFYISASFVVSFLGPAPEPRLVRVSAEVASDGTLASVRPTHEPPISLRKSLSHSHFPTACVAHRIRAATPFGLKWETVPMERGKKILRDYEVPDDCVFREATLAFYKSFRILEVFKPMDDQDHRRTYVLFRPLENKFDIRPLNGTSSIIQGANAEKRELTLDKRNVKDYLRFFCWAVHAEKGPFRIPHYLREIPFRDASSVNKVAELSGVKFSIQTVSDEEAEKVGYDLSDTALIRLKARVSYGTDFWEAFFAMWSVGKVEMVDDKPLLSDLNIYVERYGQDGLFVLSLRPDKEGQNFKHYKRDELALSHEPIEVGSEKFLETLAKDGFAKNLKVTGAVKFCGSTFHACHEVKVQYCHFRGPVRITDFGHSLHVSFIDCEFDMGLDGNHARIGQSLFLVNCSLRAPDEGPHERIALDLDHAQVTGDIELFACRIGGLIFAPDLMVSNLRVYGCRVARSFAEMVGPILFGNIDSSIPRQLNYNFGEAATSYTPLVYLDRALVKGDLEITVAFDQKQQIASIGHGARDIGAAVLDGEATVINGAISIQGAVIKGKVRAFGAICSSMMDFSASQVHGDFSLFCDELWWLDTRTQFHCRSANKNDASLSLQNATIRGGVSLRMARIDGSVNLYRSTVRGNVNLLALWVRNDLNLTFATIGGFVNAFRRAGEESLKRPNSLFVGGNLLLSGATISLIELRGAQISGEVLALTGRFGRLSLTLGLEPDQNQTNQFQPKPCRIGSLNFSAVSVDESLDLSGLQVVQETNPTAPTKATITHSQIGRNFMFFLPDTRQVLQDRWGSKDAQALDVTINWNDITPCNCHSDISGPLNLKANTVGGDLDLRNVGVAGDIYLNDTSVGLDLHMGYRNESDEQPRITGLETSCANLNGEKLCCDGDFFLTGLVAREKVSLRGAKVKGNLLFQYFDDDPKLAPEREGAQESSSRCQGGSVTAHAQLKGNLDLAEVEVGDLALSVKNLVSNEAVIDLSKISYVRWKANDPDDKRDDDENVQGNIDVLKRMHPFDRSVWIELETNLRNEGRDRDADRLYRAMRAKQRGDSKLRLKDLTSKPQGIWEWILRAWASFKDFIALLFGYGTRTFWPIKVSALLLILSTCIFSRPQFVRAVPEVVDILKDERGTTTELERTLASDSGLREISKNWNWRDGFAMSIRYQVPIVESLTHNRWEASSQRLPIFYVRAEMYALFLVIWNWVAWPLFLIGIGANIYRGRKS